MWRLYLRSSGPPQHGASITTQSRNTLMLMRSHSPIHGVGRFACRRGASRNVNPPNARSTTIAGDRIQAKSLPECRGSKPDREEHEEHRHAAESDVHGVAQRASAGGQHLALMHRGKRPQEPKRCVGQDQAADDSHGTISPGGSPDAPRQRRRPAGCRSAPAAPTAVASEPQSRSARSEPEKWGCNPRIESPRSSAA